MVYTKAQTNQPGNDVEKLKKDKNITGLIAALKSDDAKVRLDVCKAIGTMVELIAIEQTVDTLIAVAKNDDSESVRAAARNAMGNLWTPRAWAFADFGSEVLPVMEEAQSHVQEQVLAAGIFQRTIPVGFGGNILMIIGGIVGAILGIMSGNWFFIFVGGVGGAAIGQAINNSMKAKTGSLPRDLLLAVTQTKVYVFSTSEGWNKVNAKNQVAVWNRNDIKTSLGSVNEPMIGPMPTIKIELQGMKELIELKFAEDQKSPKAYKRVVALLYNA